MKYRMKPVVIDAFKFNNDFMKVGANCQGVPDWGISAYDDGIIYFNDEGDCFIKLSDADMKVNVGDYIVRLRNGQIFPDKQNNFEKTFEAVE